MPTQPTRPTPLTTTAYAILGVLAIKSRTAYELAMEMRHCFEYFWARDDARVYRDAKTLAERGLVASERQMVGKRPRTTYAITERGRKELSGWLAEPSDGPSLDFEGLIKVFFARFATLDELLQTVRQVQDDAAYRLRVATNVRQIYLEGCAPFQDEYVHIWAFVYDFQVSNFQMLHAWARRTIAELERWADLSPEGKRQRAIGLFEARQPAPDIGPDLARLTNELPAMPGMYHRRRKAGSRTASHPER